MMNHQSTIAAALLSLALTVPTAAWAETNSEKELNAATFSSSESETQVQEEEAIEQKDGMNAAASQPGQDIEDKAMDAGTGAAGAAGVAK